MEYNFREIEQKWQKRWVEMKTYKVCEDENKKKLIVENHRVLIFCQMTRMLDILEISKPEEMTGKTLLRRE